MQERIRRTPEAWLKSCEMDTSRKILVVEGSDDRHFIEYLIGTEINNNAIILEIESIDIPDDIKNGNKGRILALSALVNDEIENFKCMVDMDYSHFMDVKFPKCVISTDFIDLEAYLYEVDFLNKFLKVGLKTNKIDAKKLLNEIDSMKFFGLVRLTSLINNLNLSINTTNEKLSKFINIDKSFSSNISKTMYLEGLINKSTTKLRATELKILLDQIVVKYSITPYREIVHGKDVMNLIKAMAIKLGFKSDNIENVFWMSFDKNSITAYPKLSRVVDYLK